MKAKLPLLFLCAALNAEPGGAAPLLPADRAFAFHAVVAGDGDGDGTEVIRARWDIADGYYLYRDKTSFAITGQGRFAAPPEPPAGTPHRDALFGEVGVYFSALAMDLAVRRDGPGGYTLVAKSQGCNLPVGVCYPPMTHRVRFPASPAASLVAGVSPAGRDAASAPPAIKAPDTLERLRALIGEGYEQPQFLPVDEAFQLAIAGVAPDRLETTFTIADGYYLYRDKIKFSGENGVRVAEVALPPGEMKDDPYFGEMAVFKHDFQAPVTLLGADPDASDVTIHATYQGCAEDGICYAPVTKALSVKLPQIIPAARAGEHDSAPPPSGEAAGGRAATAGLPGILAGAFLAGLLLTFTPCVLPMLPILSGIIAGQGGEITKRKGATLALIYVLGTATTYAAIGALAGATGEQLQAYFQNIQAVGILAAVLVVMALSLFGFFSIQVPSAVQSKWQHRTRRLGGSPPMVFILGAGSALVIGACVSPILISFLGLAISAGDPWLGAGMMVALAFGMGVPLMALGLGAGHWLPKAGKWTKTVNHVFGVLLIGVAIYLLGTLPEVPVLLLWGAFLIILSIYLGATRPLPAGADGWRYFIKGAGVVMLVWGIAALLGGFFGERNLLRPLPAGLFSDAGDPRTQPPQAQSTPLFTRIGDLDQLQRAFVRARADNKLVMVEYYADWCVDCARMERTTYRDARVRERLRQNFVALKIDVTDPRDEQAGALKKRFGVFGPPAVLFFDRNGAELKDKHFYGYRAPADFYALISAL